LRWIRSENLVVVLLDRRNNVGGEGAIHIASLACSCLSHDRRDLGKRTCSPLRRPFPFLVLITSDSCESFSQIRVVARSISKRRVENRFHVASQRVRIRSTRKFASKPSRNYFATVRQTRRGRLGPCLAAVRALGYLTWTTGVRNGLFLRGIARSVNALRAGRGS
jgi:hypothetical protein